MSTAHRVQDRATLRMLPGYLELDTGLTSCTDYLTIYIISLTRVYDRFLSEAYSDRHESTRQELAGRKPRLGLVWAIRQTLPDDLCVTSSPLSPPRYFVHVSLKIVAAQLLGLSLGSRTLNLFIFYLQELARHWASMKHYLILFERKARS